VKVDGEEEVVAVVDGKDEVIVLGLDEDGGRRLWRSHRVVDGE
jgi:hypothetical protein